MREEIFVTETKKGKCLGVENGHRVFHCLPRRRFMHTETWICDGLLPRLEKSPLWNECPQHRTRSDRRQLLPTWLGWRRRRGLRPAESGDSLLGTPAHPCWLVAWIEQATCSGTEHKPEGFSQTGSRIREPQTEPGPLRCVASLGQTWGAQSLPC